MLLVVTKFGGLYVAEKAKKENGWVKLTNAYFVRRGRTLFKYSNVEIKSRHLCVIKEVELKEINYNYIVNYINNNESLKSVIRMDLNPMEVQ